MPLRFRPRYGRRWPRVEHPTISRAQRAPLASQKWTAVQSPSVHLGHFFRAAEFFEKRKTGPGTKRSVTALDRFAKYRLILHQVASHSPPLRTLAAHDEADARCLLSTRCESRADFRAFFFLRKRVEFLDQFGPTGSHQSQPMRVMIPPGPQCISEIRQNRRAAVGIGVLLNPCAQVRR